MRRAVKLTTKFATAAKQRRISALMTAYRVAVNFYIQSLWAEPGRLDKATLARLDDGKTRLSARYKSQALKQALETVVFTKRSAKQLGRSCSCPVFRGSAVLDAKFVEIDDNKGVFDLVVKISSLRRGRKIVVPTKRTEVLNKWMLKPGARIVQGAALSETGLVVWVELPEPTKTAGDELGIDIGVNKLIADSNGNNYGCDFKELSTIIRRKAPRSKAKARALRRRDQFIRYVVNQLPWHTLRVLAIEDLKHLKTGKKKSRGKVFRKAMIPWSYRQVIEAVTQKAQEYGVHLVPVPPAYTSRTCPQCGAESASNRKGESFDCVDCGYSADADTVGALNVLARALRAIGSVESPVPC